MQAEQRWRHLREDKQSIAFFNDIEEQLKSFVNIAERGPGARHAWYRSRRRIRRSLQIFEYSHRLLPPAHPGICQREISGVSSTPSASALQRPGFFYAGEGVLIPAHLGIDVAQATVGAVVQGIQFNRPLQALFGLFVILRVVKSLGEIRLQER